MIRSATLATIVLTSLLLPASPAQDGAVAPDEATAKALEEKGRELDAANQTLASANIELQDLYADLRQRVEAARSGQDRDVRDDLARVLEDPFKVAKRAMPKPGARNASRARKAFARGLPKALDKLEHPLLIVLRPRLQAAAQQALEASAAQGIPEENAAGFADTTIRHLLPDDVPFWKIWNESLVETAPEVQRYAEARKQVRKVEEAIMVLKDPKMRFTIGAPPGMARVPGGAVYIEATEGFTKKKRRQRIRDFYIDLYEVTHEEYWSKFYADLTEKKDKDRYLPRYKDKKGRDVAYWYQDQESGEYVPPEELLKLPVTGIDAVAAMAYAAAQGKRLPTEGEWVAAARGTEEDATLYPFGDKYLKEHCNDAAAGAGKPVAVDSYPQGRSAFGVYNLAGNVKEWLATTAAGKDFEELPSGENLCIRGGSYSSPTEKSVSTKWRWELPGISTREADVGFRCAKNVEIGR